MLVRFCKKNSLLNLSPNSLVVSITGSGDTMGSSKSLNEFTYILYTEVSAMFHYQILEIYSYILKYWLQILDPHTMEYPFPLDGHKSFPVLYKTALQKWV